MTGLEILLNPQVLTVIAQSGAVGIVVIIIFGIAAYVYLKTKELDSENRHKFTGALEQANKNTEIVARAIDKQTEVFGKYQEHTLEEKKLVEIRCNEHRLRIHKYANKARQSNRDVFECPNCKFTAEITDENISKIIKEVE